MDGRANRLRGIEGDVEMNGGRNLFAQNGQQILDPVDHLHRVRAGLPLDGQDDAADVVEPRYGLIHLNAVDDVPELFQPHRVAVFPGNDDGTVSGGIHQLTVRLHGERLLLAV